MSQQATTEADRQMERLARIEALVDRIDKLQAMGMFDFARLGRRWALQLMDNLREARGTLDSLASPEGEV